MALPARTDITAAADVAALKAAHGDLRDFLAAQFGGQPVVELTIAAGTVSAEAGSPAQPTPTVTIDTQSDDTADDLTNITVDQFEDGQHILVGLENAARVVTLKHGSGGSGQLSMSDGLDLILSKTTQWVLFYINKTGTPILVERARWGFDASKDVTAKTASAYTVLDQEDGATFTNTGAGAQVAFTLPTARKGLRFRFYVAAAQNVRVLPGASDEIMYQGTAGSTGLEDNVAGSFLELFALDATTWLVTSSHGTWTAV